MSEYIHTETESTMCSNEECSVSDGITGRVRVDYDIEEQQNMEIRKKIVLLEIELLHKTGNKIYDNQEECSLSVVSKFHNRKIINIMVVALTQSGKTGTMNALIKNYLHATTNLIPIENIYIITGLSSREWVKQTKDRIPKSIQERVFHRDHLSTKFVKDIVSKKNVLVIIDEIQIAAKENQKVSKAFTEAGFYNKKTLMENDIKIVEFSATPDGTVYDLMNWGEHGIRLKMEPGANYTSCFDLLKQGRVKQFKDLCGYNGRKGVQTVNRKIIRSNIKEIKEDVDKYESPYYHIIRTPSGSSADYVIEYFKDVMGDDMSYLRYDKESEIDDINKVLNKKPIRHTYIFIKEKLRCAKTLTPTYLGVLYERYTKKPNDSTIVQGLIGRGTGYHDNGSSIFYTNIDSIKRYKRLWDTVFDDKSLPWISNTTHYKRNELSSSGTYNNPSLIDGMDVLSETSIEDEEPTIKKFSTFSQVKEYVTKTLGKKRGPNDPVRYKNKDGFYECLVRNVRKVWSDKEMYIERKCNVKNGAGYGFRYCYTDIEDKSTLQFWVIHY